MKKIHVINFSIAYTKYISKLFKKISNDQIFVEHIWCKNMGYWEATENKLKNYKEMKMKSISVPIKNDYRGKYYETFSFNFLLYLIKKKPDVLIIDSNLPVLFFDLVLAKLIKSKIISLTTNFPDKTTTWGKISDNILKFNDSFVDHYVVPSTKKKNDLIKLGIKNYKITPIGHGVDIDLFKIRDKKIIKQIPTNKKIILSIGAFNVMKGKKFLIESFYIVKKQLEDSYLILIGEGSEKQNIINTIKEKKLDEDVLLLDSIPNSMIPEYYAMADIVVVPTTKPEPFGPIYLESMACGKPIVSFDVGGGEQDLVSNEKNGILVKNKDVDQMAKAIIKILKDKDLQRSMGAHSRKIIEKNYSYDKLAEKWRDVLFEISNTNKKES